MQDRQPSHKAPGANLEATWQSRVELRRPSRTKNIQPVGCSGINKLPLLHLFPCCAVPPALSPGSHLCRGPNCPAAPARYSGRLGIPSGTEYSTAKHWKAGNPKVACQCNKDASCMKTQSLHGSHTAPSCTQNAEQSRPRARTAPGVASGLSTAHVRRDHKFFLPPDNLCMQIAH